MYWIIYKVCYNLTRWVMERKKIKVYTNLDKVEKSYNIMAIKNNDVIKYIDLENNVMIIDMANDVIKRENQDYIFNIDFKNSMITIKVKKFNKTFDKSIKVLIIDKNNRSYLVRYILTSEEIVNEYYIEF